MTLRPIAERMWARAERRRNGCIEFVGATDGNGYGQVMSTELDRPVKAHRIAWESVNGPISGELFVLHRCDNRRCVNPEHLFLGTNTDNMQDMVAKGRHANQQKTHCKHGHLLSGENLRFVNGSRVCRTCRNAATRRWRQARKAAAA